MGPGFESQQDHIRSFRKQSKPCKTQFLQGFFYLHVFEILKNKALKFMEYNYKEKERRLKNIKHSFVTEFEN